MTVVKGKQSRKKRELSTEEKLKQINNDFKLWCKNFVSIISNDGLEIPFVLNKQQEYFYDNLTSHVACLKSRQLGLTTVSLALCLYEALRRPNTNYLIVSYKGDSSSSLFEKIKGMNNSLPRDKFPFPEVRRDNREELMFSNGSRIQCVVAGTKELGRGNTYFYVLLSEFAFYDDQEKVLLAVEQSLAKTPESKLVIETTANGFNYFQELWSKAKKSQSRYKPFFFGWTSSAYKELFKHSYQEAVEWYKSTDKGRMLKSEYLDPEERKLWEAGATLTQICWRRYMLLDLTKEQFDQEYPATDVHAFISTGNSVFDQNKILTALDNVMPELRYAEYQHELPEGLKSYHKHLHIFHLPKAGVRYYAGVDTASGSGGSTDNSAISVFSKDGVQVATFYSNQVPVYRFAEVVDALGRWYNQMLICAERNSFGLPLLERLRQEYKYANLVKSRIFDRGRRRAQLGFTTSAQTKSILVTDGKEMFEKGLVLLNCTATLEEMRVFTDYGGKFSNKKTEGLRDDLCDAYCLAMQAMLSRVWYVK